MKMVSPERRLSDQYSYHPLDINNRRAKSVWRRTLNALWTRRRRIATFICLLPVKIVIIHVIFNSDFHLSSTPKVTIHQAEIAKCCRNESDHVDLCGRAECLWPCPAVIDPLEPMATDSAKPKAFFAEWTGRHSFDYQQTCAIESFALLNPNLTIHVLMTGVPNVTSPAIQTIKKYYPNVHINQIRLGDYIATTPLENWYFCTNWNYESSAASYLEESLRLLTLLKYGGYYLDLNVIPQSAVTSYRNFVVAQDDRVAESVSVIHVDQGHPLIMAAVEEFRTNYNSTHIGEDWLTYFLKKWCRVDRVADMNDNSCRGFNILPSSSFHPLTSGTGSPVDGKQPNDPYFRSCPLAVSLIPDRL